MHVIPNTTPAPRLLSTAAADHRASDAATANASSEAKLKDGGLFSGNGVAIFVGLGIAAALIGGAGFLVTNHTSSWNSELPRASFVPVPPPPVRPPQAKSEPMPSPIVVQLTPELFRVTAISLGHPRLAVINGQQVGEGDNLVVHTPTANIAVRISVSKIRDGAIELTDGSRKIAVPLRRPDLKALRKS